MVHLVDAEQETAEHRSHRLLQNTLCPKMAPSFAETPDLTVTKLQIWPFCIQNYPSKIRQQAAETYDNAAKTETRYMAVPQMFTEQAHSANLLKRS